MEKVKITQKEFDDIYELIPDIQDKQKDIPEEKNALVDFEQYTEEQDEKMVDLDA